MKKLIVIFVCFIVFLGCKPLIQEHKLTSTVLNRLKSPFSGSEIDSIDLVDYSFTMNNNILATYNDIKQRNINGHICADCPTIIWKDNINEWAIKEEDILYMDTEIKKHRKIKWDKKELTTEIKSIEIIDYPLITDNTIIDKERMKRIHSNHYMYSFSTPIFNFKKNIAIISYTNVYLETGETLIYKKTGNEWVLIGEFD